MAIKTHHTIKISALGKKNAKVLKAIIDCPAVEKAVLKKMIKIILDCHDAEISILKENANEKCRSLKCDLQH